MDKRWTIKSEQEEKVKKLQEETGIPSLYCRLLLHRGIETGEEAEAFFNPQPDMLHDPFLMKDMDKAIGRIKKAIQTGEKILLYGDYDVDGTTSVALLYTFLRDNFPAVQLGFYVPNRYKEGYGLSIKGIDYAKENDFTLLIVLDCGIKATDKAAYARGKDIDLIIGDHHHPGEELPEACAILNPKQKECRYPYKDLSGCGIGFKLISAINQRILKGKGDPFTYLDLVATSIAADVVPLTGENRVLASLGLHKINANPHPAMEALLEVSAVKGKTIDLRDVAFMIAPRINAAGRMMEASIAVSLFIEKDPEKRKGLAETLQALNEQRKLLDRRISEEILTEIDQKPQLRKRKTTVMFGEQWHKGVIGIVASRTMETYYRPTIILSKDKGSITGSARSVKGFNIYHALCECTDYMERFGGHDFAAGMTLKDGMEELFARKFEEVVAENIDPQLLIPEINIEAEVEIADITTRFYNTVQRFKPFGPENEEPVFLLRNVVDNGYSKILKGRHILFELIHPGCPEKSIAGIGFNLAAKFPVLLSKKPFDLCFKIDKNHFGGKSNLQLHVIDLRYGDRV